MSKRILITGKNSYVGNQLAEWLNKKPQEYTVVKKSVRDDKWKEIDFSNFDVVVHVAGIAHQDTKKDQEDLYYKVNTDLTIDIAMKAKVEGVKQFIFMSSMIVYGASSRIGEPKVITKETIPEPVNFYGNSKLLAEKGIQSLQSDSFNVVIVRPPMIYGKGSKGNYLKLAKLAQILPVFPDIENTRSMLYIDNLCELIKLIINYKESGIFFPQNNKYVKTSEMVKVISNVHGKKMKLTTIFNKPLQLMAKKINLINKVFGNLSYDSSLSSYHVDYRMSGFEESIKLTERRN
ncbi:NAD-dependent epimerase/dehydratase family protein [Desemzia sp. FAM 23991]|uniref:NAD-dependent epimerase/dehydratase family protein n=1 Tax=unclassified Desemzia TaxID=2685243 RepID=UPI00388ADFBE